MTFNEQEKQEIVDYLNIFEIKPVFKDNKIDVLLSKNGIYQETMNSKILIKYPGIPLDSICILESKDTEDKVIIDKPGEFLIMRVIDEDEVEYKSHHRRSFYYESYQLTFDRNEEKTIEFINYDDAEILFRIMACNREQATSTLEEIEYCSGKRPVTELEPFKEEFKKDLIKSSGFTKIEAKIALKYVLMHISNAHRNVRSNSKTRGLKLGKSRKI